MSKRQIIMEQRKWGHKEPVITPATSVENALTGFERAVLNSNVAFVQITELRERRRRKDEDSVLVHTPLITFTRYGDQEFENGRCPWWETAR